MRRIAEESRASRKGLGEPVLRCTLCGQEIVAGEDYWRCNGFCVCGDCLPDFARQELAPCRVRRGKEAGL